MWKNNVQCRVGMDLIGNQKQNLPSPTISVVCLSYLFMLYHTDHKTHSEDRPQAMDHSDGITFMLSWFSAQVIIEIVGKCVFMNEAQAFQMWWEGTELLLSVPEGWLLFVVFRCWTCSCCLLLQVPRLMTTFQRDPQPGSSPLPEADPAGSGNQSVGHRRKRNNDTWRKMPKQDHSFLFLEA